MHKTLKRGETLIYSVWRCCFTFFETVEDGRVHSCFKKSLRLAMQSWETRTSFPELVRADATMQPLLSAQKMDELFNPASFLVYEGQIFSRVFGEQA